MNDENKYSTPVPRGLAGLLCYFIPFLGGLLFLFLEKESRLVRFHAVQSILLWACFTILAAILSLIPIINVILYLFVLIVWVFIMYQALMERMFELPLIGSIAMRQVSKGEDQ